MLCNLGVGERVPTCWGNLRSSASGCNEGNSFFRNICKPMYQNTGAPSPEGLNLETIFVLLLLYFIGPLIMPMCVTVTSSNTYILDLDNSVILPATSRWGLFNPFLKKVGVIKKKFKSKNIFPPIME